MLHQLLREAMELLLLLSEWLVCTGRSTCCSNLTLLQLQLQQRLLTVAKEAAGQASTHSLIGKRRISLFSMLSASLPIARPLSSRLQSTLEESSALEMIDDEPSSTARNVTWMVGQPRFVLPLVTVQGIAVECRRASPPIFHYRWHVQFLVDT